MWGLLVNHNGDWIRNNLFGEGFIVKYQTGEEYTWHITHNAPERIAGSFYKSNGEVLNRHIILFSGGQVTEIGYYYPDKDEAYWIYKWHRKTADLFEVERTNVAGETIHYTVEVFRDSAGKAAAYQICMPENKTKMELEYDLTGKLVKEEGTCPDSGKREAITYEYDDMRLIAQYVSG